MSLARSLQAGSPPREAHVQRLLTAAVAACLAALSQGHSWVACSDYRGSVNYFEQERCLAWPRQWDSRGNLVAPRANGYQIADGDSRAWAGGACDIAMSSPWQSGYSTAFPHAIYEQGRVYCLAWPMKNHATTSASCQNPHAKSDAGVDESLTLRVSSANPISDPSQAEFGLRNINELAGLATRCSPQAQDSREMSDECQLGLEKQKNGEADCRGFQRAPKFCENTGAAMGTGCFRLPFNMTPGHYVAQWYWRASFVRGSATQTIAYSSCFDFEAVAAGSQMARSGTPGTTGEPDSELPCQNNVHKFSGSTASSTSTSTTPPTEEPMTATTTSVPTSVPAPATPSPAPADTCAQSYEHCAGYGFSLQCCSSDDSCTYHNGGPWARCIPSSSTTLGPALPPTQSPAPARAPADTCAGPLEHCAGEGFGQMCCTSGHVCTFHNGGPWARCLPTSTLLSIPQGPQHHEATQHEGQGQPASATPAGVPKRSRPLKSRQDHGFLAPVRALLQMTARLAKVSSTELLDSDEDL